MPPAAPCVAASCHLACASASFAWRASSWAACTCCSARLAAATTAVAAHFLFLNCLETCCHCCNVQPWGLASGRLACSLFGSGHVNDYVILFVVRLFLAEGWHCKPFLSWSLLLLLVLVYIHERSKHFHPFMIFGANSSEKMELFSILSRFFSILSQRFGANFSERMEFFLMFHVCRLVPAEQAIEKAMRPSSRLWL